MSFTTSLAAVLATTTPYDLLTDFKLMEAAVRLYENAMGLNVFVGFTALALFAGLYLVTERIETPIVAALLTGAAIMQYLPPRAAAAGYVFMLMGGTGVAYKLWSWRS